MTQGNKTNKYVFRIDLEEGKTAIPYEDVLGGPKARPTESLVSSLEKIELCSVNSEALSGSQVYDRCLLFKMLTGDTACTGNVIREQERFCNKVLW